MQKFFIFAAVNYLQTCCFWTKTCKLSYLEAATPMLLALCTSVVIFTQRYMANLYGVNSLNMHNFPGFSPSVVMLKIEWDNEYIPIQLRGAFII